MLERLTAALTGMALATGLLVVAAVPAAAAAFAVTITASASTVTVGARVTIKGAVSPRPSSRTLYLQRRYVDSTGWTTVKKFYATSTGRYSVTTGFGNDRDRYYRVYKPRTATRKAGYSSAVQVVVNLPATGDPATLTSVSPGTEPLSGGLAVTITGTGLAGTTRVTVTPQVLGSQTRDGTGILPELPATFEVVDAGTLRVTPPASLGGVHLVKVYTPAATLTGTIGYARAVREPSDFERELLEQLTSVAARNRPAGVSRCQRSGSWAGTGSWPIWPAPTPATWPPGSTAPTAACSLTRPSASGRSPAGSSSWGTAAAGTARTWP